jgi:hypothetical protein
MRSNPELAPDKGSSQRPLPPSQPDWFSEALERSKRQK